ncbi:uncharacterized protein MONBRDRAFT_24816 [Monosiga brevicollis MX1]|uniref:Protein kinase domain-containing protein n=1 Tax=Monosiga brevicollis TaxID=81824 RepID=A9UXT8_MONBE|nr:uncharacterized protein MONBRDRAFT_24816 [Monosiga brevicollis MX1]EDQ89903.1 predicted protein [Monosiga brevicollis MX1]|eukprot:XP_001745325.1 hypothetical protein [Monosiga brevicollis MX1]
MEELFAEFRPLSLKARSRSSDTEDDSHGFELSVQAGPTSFGSNSANSVVDVAAAASEASTVPILNIGHTLRSRKVTNRSSTSGMAEDETELDLDADDTALEGDESDLETFDVIDPAEAEELEQSRSALPLPAAASTPLARRRHRSPSPNFRRLLDFQPSGSSIREAIGRDLGRMRQNAVEHSVSFVGSFFGCLFGSSQQAVAKKQAPRDPFLINFEDIQQLKWIGAGAHGCVFLGHYNQEEVAVKKFREEKFIFNEERTLRELKHENIIGLKGVCKAAPVFCLVMEYCPRSLYDVIQSSKIPAPLVVEWSHQIANGMLYLHEQGIVHRDLKSPNILVAQDKRTLKISDFGTSTDMPAKSTKMSFTGTCAWMAPELLRGEKSSGKVDVYSFAVVLWELLSGEVPYKGVDVGAIIWGVGSGRLQLPVPEGTPDGFSLLLKQCWNKEGKHRPSFRQIQLHLGILRDDTDFAATPDESYFQTQLRWKREIRERFEEMSRAEDNARQEQEELLRRRNEEMKHVEDVRALYETRLAEVLQLHTELQAALNRVTEQEVALSGEYESRVAKDALSANAHSNGKRRGHRRRRRSNNNGHGNGDLDHGTSNRSRRLSNREATILRRASKDVERIQIELEQSLEDVKRQMETVDEDMLEA